MKGKILGYSEPRGSGAIAAEDGTRHIFTLDDWRGARPPSAGTSVDFESCEGVATEIYPLAGAAFPALGNVNVDLGGLAASPNGAKAVAMFTQSLAAPLALVVLAACFMNAITSPMMSVSLIDLGKVLDGLNLAGAAQSMAGTKDAGVGMAGTLLVLRFVAPLTALWLIWSAWAGKPERVPMIATGASAIGAALLVIGLKATALSFVPDFAREELSAVISFGTGVWLLILAGGALIAAGFGKIRNPLAKA